MRKLTSWLRLVNCIVFRTGGQREGPEGFRGRKGFDSAQIHRCRDIGEGSASRSRRNERLLGLNYHEVRVLGQDIVLEEMLAVISSLNFEPIDGNLLLERSAILIQPKLEEVGFRLININIQRISRATKGGEVEMGEE